MTVEDYETVIGLEVHCQLSTDSKLFCGCSTKFGASANHHTCPVCLGLPGVLPVVNRKAIDYGIRLALALDAKIHPQSIFARKQYFYPDLPKGYQITQFEKPYCTDGRVTLASGKVVRIMRIHFEEDAGKNIHAGSSSFVDLNRAGTPLLEIVTHPDLSNAEETVEYLRKLRSIARFVGVTDGNMAEGSFRCDVNVSLRKRGEQKLGTRCEIKNLNSFKSVSRALRYEVLRQADYLDAGKPIRQETLLFDVASGKTAAMRSKEDSPDYRYFPDPDILPLHITEQRVEDLKRELPELPEAMAQRFCDDLGLTAYDAAILTSERELSDYFLKTVANLPKSGSDAVQPKTVANWILTELMGTVTDEEEPYAFTVTPEDLAMLLKLISNGAISGKIAKKVLQEMLSSQKAPSEIVRELGLEQLSDASIIQQAVDKVLAAAPAQVEEFIAGKEKVLGFFIGQIMKEGRGRFNPELTNRILQSRLNEKKQSSS